MSSPERAVVFLLTDIAFSFDGAVLGLTLAVGAVRSAFKYASSSAALRKIKEAPEVSVSDLRLLIPTSEDQSETQDHATSYDQRIVVVRGIVKPKMSGDGSHKNNVLISPETGDKALIIQRTQSYVYNGWRNLFSNGPRFLLDRSLPKQGADFLRMVPFVIVEKDPRSQSNFLVVNMDGSSQHLPLTTVYNRLQPINSSPYGFLQVIFRPEYPVGLIDVEKILPPGKAITAVGICSFNNGVPEIKSCQDLPYFLTEMTKDKMILNLMDQTSMIFWGSVIMGVVSVGILSYAAVRTWNKWKIWNQHRELPQTRDQPPEVEDENEDAEEIPDGQLCVICVTRRRIPAFIPCGHIVCCRQCALTVEREINAKCPVCLQTIRGSMRVYYS